MEKGKKKDTKFIDRSNEYDDYELWPELPTPSVSPAISVSRPAGLQHTFDANDYYFSPPTPRNALSSLELDDMSVTPSRAMCLGTKRKFSRLDNSCASPKQEFIDPFGTPSPSTDRSNPKRRMASDIAVRSGSNQCQPQSHAATSTVMSRIPESAPVMFHPASSHRSPGIYHTQPGRQSTTINLGDNGYGQNQLSSQQIANRFHVASTPARNITAVPSTIHVQNSFDIYYRHLFAKERGTPLWIPSPNNSLPITYRRKGISIGDVGIITKNGAFDFLFNVCLPHDDEINRNRVPADFSPLNPPLLPENDIQIYEDLGEGAYLSSESIKKDISDVGPSGITFESSACEGAILTIPHGAYTEDLANRAAFKRYLSDNVSSWYKYANGVRGREVNNGDLRLVTGVDKSRAWGMATFANVTEQTNLSLKLRFKPSKDSRVGTLYTWDYSGIADSARSGPGRREIEALWMGDESQGMHAFENQSLFVRTLSAKLQEDQWEKLEYELRTSSILTDQSGAASKNTAGPNFTLGPPSSSARSGASSGSHKTPMSRNGYTVLSSATENLVRISDTPTALKFHPSNVINDFLLQSRPNAWLAITDDWDWISILEHGDLALPASNEILARLTTTYEVTETHGVASLTPKDALRRVPVVAITSAKGRLRHPRSQTMADTFNAESDSPQTVVTDIVIEEPLHDPEDGVYDEETGAPYSLLWTTRSWQSDSGSTAPDSWNHMLQELSISSGYPSYPNSTPSSPQSPQRLQLPTEFHSESPFEQPPHRYPGLLEVPHRHHHSRSADDNHSTYSDDSSDSVYFSSGEDFYDEAQDIHPVIQPTAPTASSSHEEIGITSYREAVDVPIAGPQHLHGHPKSWNQWNVQPAPVSSQPQFTVHKTASSRSHEVTLDDMMSLLADSGSPITSQDPSIIRQQFLDRLSLSDDIVSQNFFRKPAKAKVSSMAGLRASSSRKKFDPTFFCELDYCKAGFTRKNGLLNHYRAHLGISDKECKFCHMFFITSLRRHEKKCKSNPDNEKHSPAKTVAA